MQLFQPAPLNDEIKKTSRLWQNFFKAISARFGSGKLPASITVSASPFVYQNSTQWDQLIIVQGGTVSKIEFTRDKSSYYDIGVTAGMIPVPPGDFLRVTYSSLPTMTQVNV